MERLLRRWRERSCYTRSRKGPKLNSNKFVEEQFIAFNQVFGLTGLSHFTSADPRDLVILIEEELSPFYRVFRPSWTLFFSRYCTSSTLKLLLKKIFHRFTKIPDQAGLYFSQHTAPHRLWNFYWRRFSTVLPRFLTKLDSIFLNTLHLIDFETFIEEDFPPVKQVFHTQAGLSHFSPLLDFALFRS